MRGECWTATRGSLRSVGPSGPSFAADPARMLRGVPCRCICRSALPRKAQLSSPPAPAPIYQQSSVMCIHNPASVGLPCLCKDRPAVSKAADEAVEGWLLAARCA